MIPLIKHHRQALVELCRTYGVRQLELFGSAAEQNDVAAARDLDFLVICHDRMDMGPADQYFGLLAELQRLFNRPVDLVCADVMQNPYFIREVNRTRNLLYAA